MLLPRCYAWSTIPCFLHRKNKLKIRLFIFSPNFQWFRHTILHILIIMKSRNFLWLAFLIKKKKASQIILINCLKIKICHDYYGFIIPPMDHISPHLCTEFPLLFLSLYCFCLGFLNIHSCFQLRN